MEGVSTTYDDRRALRGVFCLFGTAVCWSFMGSSPNGIRSLRFSSAG